MSAIIPVSFIAIVFFGFVVSGRLNIKSADLAQGQFIKVVASKIKGFPEEMVIIDEREYEDLDENLKAELFNPVKE